MSAERRGRLRRRRRNVPRWQTGLRYAWARGRIKRLLLWSAGALAVVWIGWIAVTGILAARAAGDIHESFNKVRYLVAQGDLGQARQEAAGLPALAHRAHALTSGPAWWAAAALPWIGRPFEIARDTTTVADQVGTSGVPALLDVAARLNPQDLRVDARTVDLKAITEAAPELDHAARTLDAALAELDRIPPHSWLSQVDGMRDTLASSIRSIQGYVDAGARTAHVLPRLLGADGPRRYFVGLQNEAELRGTGGLPGAFAILVADHGTVRFTHFESDKTLLPAQDNGVVPTGLDFGAAYRNAYGASGPTELFQNSNLSPHFPYAAQVWAAMWQKVSGEHVDGALAVDPQVLANFLTVTGPVTMPGGLRIGPATVVALTQQEQYALFPDPTVRKNFLVDVLKIVADKILDGSASPLGLVQATSVSSQERRVLLWSSDPQVESAVRETNYAGAVPDDGRPFVGLVLNNVVGGKLDYYLSRSVRYTRVGCGTTRAMTVTITLRNDAPATGLPPIVTGRLDGDTRASSEQPAPGDNRTLLDYYATAGAELTSVTVDGDFATASVLLQRGHPVFRLDLELPRGETREVVLHLREPAGAGPVQVWRQPGVVPLQIEGLVQDCSG